MANYSIPNIPVLATQLNDTDLFEKADGPASGQSQRFTGALLKAYVLSKYTSGLVAIPHTQSQFVNHGLGVVPNIVSISLVNVTSENGYSIGDVIPFEQVIASANVSIASPNLTIVSNATQIGVVCGVSSTHLDGFISAINLLNKSGSGIATITPGNWNFRFDAISF